MMMNQTPNLDQHDPRLTRLTTEETIARLIRLDNAWDQQHIGITLRDMLTGPIEHDPNQPWADATNKENTRDYLDDLIADLDHDGDYAGLRDKSCIEHLNTMLELLLTLPVDAISTLRLNESLCPMHACDYAICFDDEDAECASIRAHWPSHDT